MMMTNEMSHNVRRVHTDQSSADDAMGTSTDDAMGLLRQFLL